MEKNNAFKTNKTPHVMRIITGETSKSNPIVDKAFKQEIIDIRELAQDTFIEMQKQLEIQKQQMNNQEVVLSSSTMSSKVVNVMEELVYDLLFIVLERFKCCKCEDCISRIVVNILKELPSYYISVTDEYAKYQINELKIQNYQTVLRAIIRAAVKVKNAPIH